MKAMVLPSGDQRGTAIWSPCKGPDGGVGWDAQDLAGVNYHFLSVDLKLQRAFDHVADLLVKMLMQRYHSALLQCQSGEHRICRYNILPRHLGIQLLQLDVSPTMKSARLVYFIFGHSRDS